MRALLTRDSERSSEYVRALAAIGYAAECLPVTRTAPALDQPALLGAANAITSYHAVGFASQAAVQFFGAALARAGRQLAPYTTAVAVGESTRRALADIGITAQLAAPANAVGLATTILAALAQQPGFGRGMPARVLLPRAEDGRPEAGEALRRAHVSVDEAIAYRTQPRCRADLFDDECRLLDALQRGDIGALCVFAPSQVSALANLLGTAPRLLPQLAACVVAIGETTARALRQAGIALPLVATAPTAAALAAALRQCGGPPRCDTLPR